MRRRPPLLHRHHVDWRKARRDLALAASSHVFYKIVGYVVLMILTRYLAKDEMGRFFFAASLAASFALFADLGVGSYLIREAARRPEQALQRFSEVLSLRLPLFGLYFLGLAAFAVALKPGLLGVILLTGVYVFLEEVYTTFGALFVGLKRIPYNVVTGISAKLLLAVLVLSVSRLQGGLEAILACYVVANAVLVAVAAVLTRWKLGPFYLTWSPATARRVLPLSLPFFALTVLVALHFRVDTLMLGFFKPYAAVATYEAGFKLLEASQFLVRPFGMILFPLGSQLAAREGWVELQRVNRHLLLLAGAAGGGLCLAVLAAAGLVVPAVFGRGYADSVPVLRVLYLSAPALFTNSFSVLVAKSMDLERSAVKVLLASVALNAALNVVSIPLAGPVGAAWTSVISQTACAAWLVRMNARALRTRRTPARGAEVLEHAGPASGL